MEIIYKDLKAEIDVIIMREGSKIKEILLTHNEFIQLKVILKQPHPVVYNEIIYRNIPIRRR
ncbi:MAG: hypothetical protein KKD44_29215 [Proteobacteria bacterium]|nr:hypothetical protein [Pseudomonadota bacterium]